MQLRRYILAACVCALPALSQDLRIGQGIAENQVLQRNAEQTASITLSGTVTGKKTNGKAIEIRLMNGTAVVSNFDWTAVGKVQRLKWTAEIIGVPMGGPYTLEVRMHGSDYAAAIHNILVGDLWILAGQSNMEGNGDLVDVQAPLPQVHTFDMADKWDTAKEPLHTLPGATDRVHWRLNDQKQPERWTGARLDRYISERKKGAGLALPFAAEMVQRTGVPIGLLPCAHGGTSMAQWDPALKSTGGDSLYGAMLRRFQAAGGQVKGMLWYQGEAEANPQAAPVFETKFIDFVKAVRADFKEPDLPFYYVQIGRHVNDTNQAQWNAVQVAQLKAESEIPHAAMVSAVDVTLDDSIHVSTPDLKRLGKELANVACHDLFPRLQMYGELKGGPRPVSAKVDNNTILVAFSGVNGKLESFGRVSGFSIQTPDGKNYPAIYKAFIDPAQASTVRLYFQGKLPDKATLWYGAGKDPYCNLRDAADMGVPVFEMAIQ